jgi:ATP-dependent protease Clp ATPase subunit
MAALLGRRVRSTCAFCGKRRENVALLIPGGQGGTICDECVDVAAQLVAEHRAGL